jgi:hypothetical protein
MADLVDTSTAWESGIYQIETTDPVLGGPPNLATGAGMSNIPHLQLARRTQWLRGQLGGFGGNVAYTVNGAIPAANIGLRGVWTPATAGALTLPAIATVPVGASFYLAAGGAAVTIAPNGAEEIFGTDNVLTGALLLQRGDDVRITRGGAAWAVTGGSVALLRSRSLGVGSYKTARTENVGGTLTAADAGTCYVFSGTSAATVTLPLIADTLQGSVFEFLNTGTADLTVQRAGSDQIDNGPAAVTSIVVPPNQSLRLVRASASSLWHPVGFNAAALAQPMGSSLAGSGWQRLPSGLIMQWGAVSQFQQTTVTRTLPVAFTIAAYATVASKGSSIALGGEVSVGIQATTTQYTITNTGGSSTVEQGIFWMAFGR